MTSANITQLLSAWKDGDRTVENALAQEIYPVLLDLARSQARRHRGVLTLSATELAHEAFERIHQQRGVEWQNRTHFFSIASTVIRRVLVDYLRARHAEKRGGEAETVALDELLERDLPSSELGMDWLGLDQLLNELATEDQAAMRVVEMRVFTGMTVEEIAETMGSSVATVGRQWRFARAWLGMRLKDHDRPHD